MPYQRDLRFTFALTGGLTLDVVSFQLEEALSEPFVLTLDLSSTDPAIDFGQVLDRQALFTVWRGETPVRYVHGLVSSFAQGDSGVRRTRYRAVLEPALARLGLCSGWRMFQQQSVPDIVQSTLRRAGMLDVHAALTRQHLIREYCVQPGETDLAFIERLCAEEGIYYAFTHSAQAHRLVLGDYLYTHGTAPGGSVIYHTLSGGDAAEPCLRAFHYTEQVRTAVQTQKDYSFKHPQYAQLHTHVATNLDHQRAHYERYDYPGRYKRDAAGKPFTENRLLGLRRDAQMAFVEGDDARLVPGLAFTLTGHVREDWNTKWRVVRMVHEGYQSTSQEEDSADATVGTRYSYRAEVVPEHVEWRPAPHPKPRIDGPQIATVVGPPNEEIYTDEYGRIRVQFPWDREGKNDEHSSCWIRVGQGWAGVGWGQMALPRIGSHVIVSYVDGDGDQPLVTGSTYSATNPPPYALPHHKTRTTIKSQTHKGDGYNEVSLEDEQGREQIIIHAQRDFDTHVLHDATRRIDHDDCTRVGHDAQRDVGHDETLSVGNDRHSTIGHDDTLSVSGKRSSTVAGDDHVRVHGSQHTLVQQTAIESVALAKSLNVGGGYNLAVGGLMAEEIGGNKLIAIGQDLNVHVGNKGSLGARLVHIDAGDELLITCGGAFLRMAGGRLAIGAPDGVLVQADVTQTAPARMGSAPPPGPRDLEFRSHYGDGAPMIGATYVATLSDGSTRRGSLDSEGYARLAEVPVGASATVRYDDTSVPVTAHIAVNLDDPDLQRYMHAPLAPSLCVRGEASP